MKKCLIGIAMFGILMLSGCGISAGYVAEKNNYAAYSWVQMVCSSYSKEGYCTVQTPVIHYVPERFVLGLKLDDETGSVDVSETTYNDIEIGDWYGNPTAD